MREECLYHCVVNEYVQSIIPRSKVAVANINSELEDSDCSSDKVRKPIKRFQFKIAAPVHHDDVQSLDFSGTSTQDERDACGASQLKNKNVEIINDSIEFDKTDSSVVSQSSLPKPKKLTLMEIRKMRKGQLIDYCVENGLDHSGLVPTLKNRITNAIKLNQGSNRQFSNLVDLTHKNDVNDYASHPTLPISNLLLENSPSIINYEGFSSVVESLNAHYVAAVRDNALLRHGIAVYDVNSVAHIYAKMNVKRKDVLLIGNKYLPNIQYRMIKTIVSLINRDYNVNIFKFY